MEVSGSIRGGFLDDTPRKFMERARTIGSPRVKWDLHWRLLLEFLGVSSRKCFASSPLNRNEQNNVLFINVDVAEASIAH